MKNIFRIIIIAIIAWLLIGLAAYYVLPKAGFHPTAPLFTLKPFVIDRLDAVLAAQVAVTRHLPASDTDVRFPDQEDIGVEHHNDGEWIVFSEFAFHNYFGAVEQHQYTVSLHADYEKRQVVFDRVDIN